MYKNKFSLYAILFALLMLLPACQKEVSQPSETTDPTSQEVMPKGGIPLELSLGVVPFNQPVTEQQLFSGYLPLNQGLISYQSQLAIDDLLRDALNKSSHPYIWLPLPSKPLLESVGESGTPQGLEYWVDYGRERNVDLLLVPQILNWRQREGSSAGVSRAAYVRMEFFLIDVQSARVFRHTAFEEEQQGLIDNFLNIGKFFERGAGWVTAEELTQEAIIEGLKELKLL